MKSDAVVTAFDSEHYIEVGDGSLPDCFQKENCTQAVSPRRLGFILMPGDIRSR